MLTPVCQIRTPVIALTLLLFAAGAWAQPTAKTFPGATWPERTPEQAGVNRNKLDALRDRLKGKGGDRQGGCVVKDGYFIYSWGAFNQRHNWASASKPGLSTLLFAAIAEGKVKGPDAPIYPYWPGLRPIDRTLTFRHLANMMSGYACADKDADGKPLSPGSRWAYNDYAIMLYARTLDKVFGGDGGMTSGVLTGLVAAAHERFTVPLQFQDTELFEKNKGRLVASPRDFARLGWLWLNQGNWNSKAVLPKSFFEQYVKADVPLDTPKTTTTLKPPFDDYLGVKSYGGGIDQGDGQGIYGFNWWYNRVLTVPSRNPPLLTWPAAPPDVFMALGRAGKDGMVIFPSLGLVVAAYNDTDPTWGDAIITEPPDPNDVMNQNLKLIVEAASPNAHAQ
jgi:CubicO group peptidase (beta-lactamase class C family)